MHKYVSLPVPVDWDPEIPDRAPSECVCKDDLSSTLGMLEMEVAARRIVKKAKKAGTWRIFVGFDDFTEEYEQTGFLHLLRGGWLDYSFYTKRAFTLSKQFIARVEREAE